MGEDDAGIGVRSQKMFKPPKVSAGLQYPTILHVERLHVLQLLQMKLIDIGPVGLFVDPGLVARHVELIVKQRRTH
ncbi:unannotated protein [freshwater metagenome]|uniref:Unannotated protein n=1 Tax=freshwater metagenome TaxID=449393 RepID=A0A6J7VR55_9ZZZZ